MNNFDRFVLEFFMWTILFGVFRCEDKIKTLNSKIETLLEKQINNIF